MDTTLVISHTSAIRGIRTERRERNALHWHPLSKIEQRRALKACIPNKTFIDFELLERIGFWEDRPTEVLDVLVNTASNRRSYQNVRSHLISRPLPAGSLLHVTENVYCCSPALSALLYSKEVGVAETLDYIMELLGGYCLPAESTLDICWKGTWPNRVDKHEVQQSSYKREPVATIKELESLSRWASGSTFETFRQAVRLARAGSASPMETIMYAVLACPMSYGGFNIGGLKGGVQLNKRIDFTHDAVLMSSGMPYAIADLFVPAARTDIEHNGGDHENAASHIHDDRRNNGLRGMDIKVVVINRSQMRDIPALEAIARKIYKDAGRRFRYQISGYRNLQAAWLNGLRRGVGLPPV